jgi:anti-sigma B factor antagonist
MDGRRPKCQDRPGSFSKAADHRFSKDEAMHLQIDVTRREGFTILSPQGEIDFATGPQLKDAITELLVAGEVDLVVDLLAVDFIESTGLGALIGGRRRAHALKGSLVLVCTEDQMLKIFRITGLDKVFQIHDTVDAAVGSTSAPVS